MSENKNEAAFDLSGILHGLQSAAVSLVNMQRENNPTELDYIQFNMPSHMAQLPEGRNFIQEQIFGKHSMSLLEFEMALDRIANDSRPKGIILFLRGLAMSLADLQSLRDSLQRFRSRGKRVIAYAQDYGMAEYFVASLADEIILQPGGMLDTTGLMRTQTFLKEGLAFIGLEADSVAISPYKGAADTFTRSEPSKEGDEQFNWLLDSQFQILISGIANGRDMGHNDVKAMIDNAPYTDKQALEAGYINAVVNEEGLAAYLKADDILLWEQADGILPLKMPRDGSQYIAVLQASGAIIAGESANPPVDLPIPLMGGERMGDVTVVRQIRNLMLDDRCAALVLYVDSPGGSAAASEATCAGRGLP